MMCGAVTGAVQARRRYRQDFNHFFDQLLLTAHIADSVENDYLDTEELEDAKQQYAARNPATGFL